MRIMRIAKVYIEHPVASLDFTFDYYVQPSMEIVSGVRVDVEFNHRIVVGYVEEIVNSPLTIDEYESQNGFKINPVLRVIDNEPILNNELRSIVHQLARTTISPVIACYQTVLPPALKPSSHQTVKVKYQKTICVNKKDDGNLTEKQRTILQYYVDNGEMFYKDIKVSKSIVDTLIRKGFLMAYQKEVYRSPFEEKIPLIKDAPVLTDEQSQVLQQIKDSSDKFYLLEGVTGSGKTEVYINLTIDVLRQNKTVLILVPEISLTPAMIRRFKERITNDIAVLHSGLSLGEKYDEYRRIARKEVQVVIGARSAIFAPLENIGLIVVDEEHSESYKQDNVPAYHVIDVVKERQSYHNCKVVLGSATPSLESKARAIKKLYQQLYLTKRINDQPMPEVEVVNMLDEVRFGNFSLFSKSLKDELNRCLANKQQALILLNRRGYAVSMHCNKCGTVFKCPNCGVALHYHRTDDKLKCHYCGFEMSKPVRCNECGSTSLKTMGIGTQKVEELITKTFPEAKVIRMDVDSVRNKGGHEKILDAFERQEYNILLGTQMIAKGLDYPNVTLVGVLNADTGLYCGDFRSNERTFQLLTQVVGRCGRGNLPGRAIIQTFNPDAYAIDLAAKQDYETFFKTEMHYRHELLYPPYRYLTTLMFLGNNIDKVIRYAEYIKTIIKKENKDPSLVILGPAEPFIPQFNNKFRMRIMLKYKDNDLALELLQEIRQIAINEKIEVHFDTSPYKDV